MAPSIVRFLSTLFLVQLATAKTSLCPLLGPDFPPPRNISQNPGFRNTVNSFSNTIQKILSTGNSSYGPFDSANNTFSINVFSTFSDAPLFKYDYTAPRFSNGSIGTKTVDGDTVFRVGSISKLITVFALLVEKGDANLNDPVTKYVPELRNAPRNAGAVNAVQWDDVTLGTLASHMSGIGRDYSGPSELGFLGPGSVQLGLPPLNASDLPPCGLGIPGIPPCNRAAFFRGILAHHPVFAPSTTPIYSNIAFQILGYAVENMANKKSFNSILSNDILKPLRLTRTSTSPPNASIVAIPSGINVSGWDIDLEDFTPAGGIYSTSNDLAKLGRAILNSTLLSPAQTRRWMKPVTHTSSLKLSVGAPWEIFRVETPRGVVDLYTKSGNLGVYASLIVLVPDYDLGWVMLSAADNPMTSNIGLHAITSLIADAFLPAAEAAAKDEAAAVFGGTYKATNGLNSSINIVTNEFPGLGVQSLISNGTDVLQSYLHSLELPSDVTLSVRLYPTNLVQTSPRQQAFRAVLELLPTRDDSSVFSACTSWGGVDGASYGNIALDEFLFHFDQYGRAVSVEPRFLRVTLQKVA